MDRERWKNLFSSITTAVTDLWSSRRSLSRVDVSLSADVAQPDSPIIVGLENISYQAECCLDAIHRIETGQAPRADEPQTYEAWFEADANKATMFPDELVEALSEMSRSSLNEHIWRVRRLQEMKQKSGTANSTVSRDVAGRTDTPQTSQRP